MKFFCEQCKAKYQIADDKVAGKTVRMKCRKCGHLIELRAEVTESSAMGGAPASTATTAPSSSPDASGKPAAPRPAARLPPRPNALATSLTATKPAPQKPERSGAGALAGAFKSNVQRDEEGSAPFDMADLAPGDDWYVAVNGVPVGPIRIAEVRRKAALGAVTEDSLVWQEGLDEWRPLKSFPDLAANVREAAAGGRISITPPPPDARHSAPPPRPPTMRPASNVAPSSRVSSSRPMQGLSPSARSNVVPFTSRLATAEKLDDAPTEIGALSTLTVAADPFALPPPAPAAPAALTPAAPAVASASGVPSYSLTDGRSRKQPPWGALAMVAGTMAFGTVAGIAIFFKPAPPPQVVVQVPPGPTAPPAASTPATNAAPGATTESAPALAVPNVPNPATGRAASAGTGSRVAEAPASTGRSLDLNGIHGSKIAPDDPGAEGAAPGQCISAGQVQQVLGLHQVAIRRSCWERNPTTRPTVNVSVAMTVGADGSAQNVSASGDDASVSKCIENDVRGWHFPAMGCAQKTGFSFKFVRQ